jgi:hypothetical protein
MRPGASIIPPGSGGGFPSAVKTNQSPVVGRMDDLTKGNIEDENDSNAVAPSDE